MAAEPAWHDVLRTLRERRGISQDGWAARLGYSRRTVQRWEQGILIPDAAAEDALLSLCAELGLLRADGDAADAGTAQTAADIRRLLAAARVPGGAASSTPQAPANDVQLPQAEETEQPVHLPAPLTSLLGRERDIAAVAALLDTTRLLTLTGPGGSGKTRLAIAVARQVVDRFPDGLWFVDLSAVNDPGGVLPAIALALDVRESDGRSLAVALSAYLRRKRLLLVLDNFEQIVTAAVTLYYLLRDAPGVTMLVTSRVLLRIEGEHEYAVPPLPLPALEHAEDRAVLSANPAVQLFLDRAQALRPDFEATGAALRAVGAICARVDGLPLAIELAAARVKLLSPAQLLARLERRLPLLTGGARSLPQRQQTLRDTIQWSWDLLSADEQTLFRRLAVFAGGFTLEAAEAVCNPDGTLEVLDGLAALVDHSLVRRREDQEGQSRFSLLATLQEFAQEQLEAAGETGAVRRAHALWYTQLAEAADAAWWRSGRLVVDLRRPLDPERDNLLAALSWALATQDATLGLRLGGALGMWFFLDNTGEGRSWLGALLEIPDESPTVARAACRWALALCAVEWGDFPTAAAGFSDAAALFRSVGAVPGLVRALLMLAFTLPMSQAERSRALAAEALQLAASVEHQQDLAFVLAVVGQVFFSRGGDQDFARECWERAVQYARPRCADWAAMYALLGLGDVAAMQGLLDEARERMRDALPVAEAIGGHANVDEILIHLGQVYGEIGDRREAALAYQKALLSTHERGSVPIMAPFLVSIGHLLCQSARQESATQLLAAAYRLRGRAAEHPTYAAWFQEYYAGALAEAEAATSPNAFAEAWAAGEALSLDEATDLALAELAAIEAETASAAAPVEA